MIVSIMQPAYLPWLGYFDRIAKSDLHIVLDSVPLERSSRTRFTNRNKIRTVNGWMWLTVPVVTAGKGQPIINTTEIDNAQNWQRKHWLTIVHSYKSAPYFSRYKHFFEYFYNNNFKYLGALLREGTDYLLESLNIRTPMHYSSETKVDGQKSDLILNLCRYFGATKYLSGPFGRDYLDQKKFESARIEISFHDYRHPVYPQIFKNFEPYMSVVDLLFNCGNNSLKNHRS